MKRKWLLCCFVLLSFGVYAEDLVIQALDHAGELSFNQLTNASGYRVEWAPEPGGPWSSDWSTLSYVPATSASVMTCSVAMCYRVIAELGIPMVQIPAGLNNGTNPLATNEVYSSLYSETYSLTVDAFYMDRTPITKSQWDNVYLWAVNNGYIFDNAGSGKGDNHPVYSVNWYDCVKWCNARSEKEGLTPCYTVSSAVYRTGQQVPDIDDAQDGYRLPTVEEYEYAARGGLANQRFPLGDTITHSNANYYSSTNYDYDDSPTSGFHPTYHVLSIPFTAPVGSFAPNGYGLYDMEGNMCSWCWDYQSPVQRHYRGGSWISHAESFRCGRVNWNMSNQANNSIGLRTVRR